MKELLNKIIGKFDYLNRKIKWYKWSAQNDNANKIDGSLHNYFEINQLSRLDAFDFSYDIEEYKVRFSKDDIFAGLKDSDGIIMAYGWINNTSNHSVGELNLNMIIPKNTCVLYDFHTFEDYRGKGLYPYLLQRICARDSKFKLGYAFPTNIPSCKGMLKANFKYIGTISGLTKSKYIKMISE